MPVAGPASGPHGCRLPEPSLKWRYLAPEPKVGPRSFQPSPNQNCLTRIFIVYILMYKSMYKWMYYE